jgi:hypothetical protein
LRLGADADRGQLAINDVVVNEQDFPPGGGGSLPWLALREAGNKFGFVQTPSHPPGHE